MNLGSRKVRFETEMPINYVSVQISLGPQASQYFHLRSLLPSLMFCLIFTGRRLEVTLGHRCLLSHYLVFMTIN